ncbi:SIR2 family NAD-dependent protein deacylase [Burkholderia ambifaria]|uniref:SIR2 family NAD-dependent protein deacylase n=1 Tax=Burkholderia ambifaria TaxID=152480 RepID=UPI0015899A2E|nr:SIR2 family protein [Burkholderia ambifaria]
MDTVHQQRVVDSLKQILEQEDTVLFIGSGISLWSGLPTWFRLVEELAQHVERAGASAELVRQELAKGDLLQAASYGLDRLSKQQFGEFIKSACRYGKAKPHDIHRMIVNLGPRCFITTNYDDLIEQSLRIWQPDRFYRSPVTNRHLTETAEIVHARSIDFIFKPHGDAGDSESIILTREQYRQLLPNGERQAALESLKMLLASRPVVYFGFGLRDPDFIYLRDLLANTYKGGVRDHYAIMSNVHELEIDYWRRNYGIHLISYATKKKTDQSDDHSPLLELLERLTYREPVKPQSPPFDPTSSDVLLAMARYAATLSRAPRQAREFAIRVRTDERRHGGWNRREFDYARVELFLTEGPGRAVLTGLPGAGKSYSISRAAANLAERLHSACLAVNFEPKNVIFPILVDLKLYRGNLHALISQTLPSSLPLSEILKSFDVKIFLDSFNELPREYWESGAYESDFEDFVRGNDASLIIGSRTPDGLKRFDFPIYSLEHIESSVVEQELDRLQIDVDGRFRLEMVQLLARPFFFRYVVAGLINLPSEPHPRDFYRSLFENANKMFASRFGSEIDIELVLSSSAYESLNRGEEAFPLSTLLASLQASSASESLHRAGISANEFANWLVSASLLVPYSGARIAFVHQSITEYLAATELARQYLQNSAILTEKLALKRWDQALFLTLGLLPLPGAQEFIRDIIKYDFELALSASKYIEFNRDDVISLLLAEVSRYTNDEARFRGHVEWIIRNLPLTDAHEPQLRSLIDNGDSLGGTAIYQLISIKGEAIKSEALPMLIARCHDFNFCNGGLAPALRPYITVEDAETIAAWADELDAQPDSMSDDEDQFYGFVSGAAILLGEIDLPTIRRIFIPTDSTEPISTMRSRVLCALTQGASTTAALELAGELLLRGIDGAATSICFIGRRDKADNPLSWKSFEPAHITRLEANLDVEGAWAVGALKALCAARADLAELVRESAAKASHIRKSVLLYCVDPSDLTPIFTALEKLLELSDEERRDFNYKSLSEIDFDWSGKSELFVSLLNLRDVELSTSILGGVYPPELPGMGSLDVGNLELWLDWILKLFSNRETRWLADCVGAVTGEYASSSLRREILDEFEKDESKFRFILARCVIPHLMAVTTDLFGEDTISFLLADLRRQGSVSHWRGHLLGNAATERFVAERLLPLLHSADEPLRTNLRIVLDQAGSRHGRRYLTN